MKNRWSALYVRTGSERDIAVAARMIPEVIAIVPIERRHERRKGQWCDRLHVLMPGYVFVQWDGRAECYYSLNKIPGVIRFLGEGKPLTIPPEQMQLIIAADIFGAAGEPAPVRIVDGRAEICGGVLAQYKPTILRVDRRSRRAKLRIALIDQLHEISIQIDIQPDDRGA